MGRLVWKHVPVTRECGLSAVPKTPVFSVIFSFSQCIRDWIVRHNGSFMWINVKPFFPMLLVKVINGCLSQKEWVVQSSKNLHKSEGSWNGRGRGKYKATTLNPLSPKSDQHQISPCNIYALSNRVVMRIRDMITLDESNRYFNKFSPLLLLKTYRDNKWEFEF